MAVTNVNFTGWENGSFDDEPQRQYVVTWDVHVDDVNDGPLTVLAASGLPVIGDVYVRGNDTDTGAKLTNLSAQRAGDDKRLVWRVRGTYSTVNSQEGQQEENPLDRPPVYQWSFAQFTRPLVKDVDGKAVVNSAGDRFIDAPEIDDSRPVLSVTKNLLAFPLALALQYKDTVNNDSFLGFDAGEVKVSNISGTQQFESGLSYWQVSYEFHFRPNTADADGWDVELLDQGFYEVVGGERSRIKDDKNADVVEEWPLNGAGGALSTATIQDPANLEYLRFKAYPRKTFSVFNF